VARHIRSYYDPETERDELLFETGQTQVLSTSSSHGPVRGGIELPFGGNEGRSVDGDGDQEEGVDPWLVELPYAPAKFDPPLKFVKSILSYEDVNDYIERGYGSGLPGKGEEDGKDVDEERRGISNWYRNLNRTNANSPVSTPVPESSAAAERTAKAGTLGYSVSSSGVANGSATPTPQRTSEQPPSSKPPNSLPQEPRPSNNPGRRNDWFISNVLPHSSPSALGSNSPTPGPRPPPTLADILARDPPPNKSQEVYTPPTWIMLPPSNPGFRILQKSGWSEGEPLGPYFARRQGDARSEQQPVAGPSNLEKRNPPLETRTTEIQIEGYDDIVEIKMEQVIDLTVSEDEEDPSSSDEDISDEDTMELDDETPQSSNVPLASSNSAPVRPLPPQGEGHGGKALLTPLPTVLKSDRLGIGLKAKTVGPYKASQKRVTHNVAALAAHVQANDERRLFKQKVGRGSRGFARAQKRESEKRKSLLAYLNQ